ncbi:MAG: DUF169 domain-containing protein [Promethearchaeota archaeon]
MNNLNIKEIGFKLKTAGRLEATPLCIYGAENIPKNAIPLVKINRCIAKAIFTLFMSKKIDAIYLDKNTLEGCCPGGRAWFGYKPFMPQLKYFLSTGSKGFRGGAAEFLLANPDLAQERLDSIGTIKPLGTYTIIQKSISIEEENIDVKSFLCFGNSEQIRNLCSLIYFQSEKGFTIEMPWGPSCASFVTYPANLLNRPEEKAIIGPLDPTGNSWFPQDHLSLGIPITIADRMARNLEKSFIMKRPEIAYPKKRS